MYHSIFAAAATGFANLALADSPVQEGMNSTQHPTNIVRVDFSPGLDTSSPAPLSGALAGLSIEFCYIIDYLGEPKAPNQLSHELLQNIQDISGAPPIIRIGGHTQDVARYDASQNETISSVFVTGNQEAVNVTFNAGLFESMSGNMPSAQRFIFGLNYGQNDASYALAEVSAAEKFVTPGRLKAYELGNEPDFYNTQRSGRWDVETYVAQQISWLNQIRAQIHHSGLGFQVAAFAQEPVYMGNFSLVELNRLGLPAAVGGIDAYSDHTYPYSQCDAERAALVSLPNLMNHINTVQFFAQWSTEIAAARSAGVSFVMGETGSVSCHGKDGVSNTLGAALWEIDYMLHGATLGMEGVYFHMGTPFFYSKWQPVEYNGTAATVYPTYYSLLFMATLTSGLSKPVIYELLALESSDLALYAVYDGSRLSKLIALNMQFYDATSSVRPSLALDVSSIFRKDVRVSRLTGPFSGVTSSERVTWQGQSYSTGVPKHLRRLEYFSSNSIKIAASEAIIIEA